MIVTLFPDPGERARAIGAFSFSAAAGGSIGNIAGGSSPTPCAEPGLPGQPADRGDDPADLRTVQADRGLGLRAGPDVAGAVLVTAGLMVGVYAIVGAAEHGWASGQTVGPAPSRSPWSPGSCPGRRRRTRCCPCACSGRATSPAPTLVQALTVAGAFPFMFLTALYTQQVPGYTATQAGLAILPTAPVIGAISLGLSARLSALIGPAPWCWAASP